MTINRLFLIFIAILIGGKILASAIFYMLEYENNSMGLVITYLAAYYSYQTYINQNKTILPTDKKWRVMFIFTAIETLLSGIGLYLLFGNADPSFADIAIPALSVSAILAFIAIFVAFLFQENGFKKTIEKEE